MYFLCFFFNVHCKQVPILFVVVCYGFPPPRYPVPEHVLNAKRGETRFRTKIRAEESSFSKRSYKEKFIMLPTNELEPEPKTSEPESKTNTSESEPRPTTFEPESKAKTSEPESKTNTSESEPKPTTFETESKAKTSEPEESEPKVYNILLLGETGVGKSTFVNAFANYFLFETLSDALSADHITALIPTRFTILDDNFESKDIIFGSDENEARQPGASATQFARSYAFKIGNSIIRLIDTPGMGDTRGIKKDEENFERLLDVIGELKEIHLVCLMLKPNDSRLTALFEYCVTQLFSYLQRSFCDNIVFLFTNSRGTLYRPGDTIIPLKKVLKDIATRPPKVVIPFSTKNVFCIDNEAFRLLIASKQGVTFEPEEAKRYSTSWDKSSDVCLSLIEYVTKIKPHKVQDTVSINEARRLVSILCEPLANVTENIVKNLRVIRQYREKLEDSQKTMRKLEEQLYIPVVNLTVTSDKPRTVCTHEWCTRKLELGDLHKIDYRVCHIPCYLYKIPTRLVGDPALKMCTEMKRGVCQKCEHSYQYHMYERRVSDLTIDKIVDKSVDQSRQSEQDYGDQLKEKIQELKHRKSTYLQEVNAIQVAMAQFAHFLTHNIIGGFVDRYKNYIEFLIERETKLGGDADKLFIKRLKKLMNDYEKAKRELEENLQKDRQVYGDVRSAVTAGQIVDVVQTLYSLKLNGSKIHEIYDKERSTRERQLLTGTEKEFTVPKDASTKFIRFFQPSRT